VNRRVDEPAEVPVLADIRLEGVALARPAA
jgi:hypothetical protein